MLGAHRFSDCTAGHGCPLGGPCGFAPPTIAGSASPNVIINGKGAVRFGDVIVPHSCLACANDCSSPCSPHSGTYLGNHSVIVNGRSIQTAGDLISCTDIAVCCSPNVIIE